MQLFVNKIEHTVRKKGENAGNQHFILFHNVFYPLKNKFNVANAVKLDKANILSSCTGLSLYQTSTL